MTTLGDCLAMPGAAGGGGPCPSIYQGRNGETNCGRATLESCIKQLIWKRQMYLCQQEGFWKHVGGVRREAAEGLCHRKPLPTDAKQKVAIDCSYGCLQL